MATTPPAPTNVDDYIAAFAPEVQAVLQKLRQAVRKAAPDATEVISYRMPALKQPWGAGLLCGLQAPHRLLSADPR